MTLLNTVAVAIISAVISAIMSLIVTHKLFTLRFRKEKSTEYLENQLKNMYAPIYAILTEFETRIPNVLKILHGAPKPDYGEQEKKLLEEFADFSLRFIKVISSEYFYLVDDDDREIMMKTLRWIVDLRTYVCSYDGNKTHFRFDTEKNAAPKLFEQIERKFIEKCDEYKKSFSRK